MHFAWRDRGGKVTEQPGPRGNFSAGTLSPDGGRVAYSTGQGQLADVWVLDVARGLSTRVTFSGGLQPAWSPDGKYLYYFNRNGLHRKAADGSGEEERLVDRTPGSLPTLAPTRDGKFLLFSSTDGFLKLPLTGERKPEVYRKTKHLEFGLNFSPDGRWVAYSSNESGRLEVFVRGYPEERGKWQISSDSGFAPHWRGDGKELYWITLFGSARNLMAASIDLQPTGVRAGKQVPLYSIPPNAFLAGNSADGRRFLFVEPEGGVAAKELPIVVIRNWAARLR